jgi:hypothetical protein
MSLSLTAHTADRSATSGNIYLAFTTELMGTPESTSYR